MNKNDLIKTATLARLHLSENEKQIFTDQIQLMFKYFNKISMFDSQNIEPLIYPLEGIKNLPAEISIREDQPQDTKLPDKNLREELLSLAPDRLGDEYKVPPVVE